MASFADKGAASSAGASGGAADANGSRKMSVAQATYAPVAQKFGMELVEATQHSEEHVTLVLRLAKGREWTLESKGGKGKFKGATSCTFLLDNLFLENFEDDMAVAASIEVVLGAAKNVYEAISSGDGNGSDNSGDEHEYDDARGVGDIVMDSSGSSNKATGEHFHDEELAGFPGLGGTGKAGTNETRNVRLCRDLSRMMRTDTSELGFSLEPAHEDVLTVWRVRLFGFVDCPLAQDLEKCRTELAAGPLKGVDHVELEMTFKDDYPYSPPFVRVVWPRFVTRTGYIIDGAFCMELLTKQGWTPTNDIESVLVQIRAQMVVGQARVDFAATQPYKEANARAAFKSAADFHKWAI